MEKATLTGRERAVATLLFIWFFLTTCCYYVLRPVRNALVLSDFGPSILPWVYMGTALITGGAVWLYTQFAHLPRKQLLGGLLLIFSSSFIILWWAGRQGYSWVSPAFYIWTDVFSIMGLTIFWIYANDVFGSSGAKRTFGVIGSAGPAGAILGAGITKSLVIRMGAINMLLIAAFIYGLAFVIFMILESLTRGEHGQRGPALENFERYNLREFKSVMGAIYSSKTLSLLTLVVCLERFVPDFVDYMFQTVAHGYYPEKNAFAAFSATFEFWLNIIVFLATLLLTAKILENWGVHFALTAVPVTIALGCAAYVAVPILGLAIFVKGMEQGQRHAWFKAGKEVVYTATNPDVIYRFKGYVEMFFYRFARGVAGLILVFLTGLLGFGPRAVAAVGIVFAILWMIPTWKLGRHFEDAQQKA